MARHGNLNSSCSLLTTLLLRRLRLTASLYAKQVMSVPQFLICFLPHSNPNYIASGRSADRKMGLETNSGAGGGAKEFFESFTAII